MIVIILGILRYGLVLIFGVAVSFLFSGVQRTRINKLITAIFCGVLILIQILFWNIFGLEFTSKIYPFIAHLPLIMFLALYCKRPWLISIISVLTAYLCCQTPRWVGGMMATLYGNPLLDHISYIITMAVVYYFLKKYVASSVRQLMERSTPSCLLFGAVPLLYYLFDYITTIYTDLLYSGAKVAVQFTPSLICTFYFVFIILYYNESRKQVQAQRELDVFASQLNQAQLELDTMRQMQSNTLIYRHDMRHHLSLIGGFAASGDIQKIKEYLANTEADIDALTPVRYCENETVNLILSTFKIKAQKKDVAFYTDVKLPKELSVNDNELCSLISNALENAINATSQVESESLRKVYIRAVINNNKLIISTENAYVGDIQMEGEFPKSKNEDSVHGFGIKSMVSIVERYGGLYSFETEGGIFILQLLLPLGKVNKDFT